MQHIPGHYDLLEHPFYQDWAVGKLPQADLRAYAADWGAFVNVIDQGWSALGREDIAAEEREHARLWQAFAEALGTAVRPQPQAPAVQALIDAATGYFSHPVTALGSLYAFEVQQPYTASSKLDGLQEHYALGAAAEEYFAVHAGETSEPEWLSTRIAELKPADQQACAAAAQTTCQLMWDALTELHSASAAGLAHCGA